MTADLIARLQRAFEPRTVCIIGDKRANGYLWLRNMMPFKERGGTLVSVQIDPNEIPGIEALGVPNYTSLAGVPGEIDYAVCAVPRQVAPRIIADCVARGVNAVALFTSGFAETGEPEAVGLQEQITRLAKEGGLLLIGPNCMGLANPAVGVRQSAEQPAQAGDVGFISQSGTHAINFGLVGAAHGVRVSKSASIGNAVALDVSDYLEYLAQDAATSVIAMYVEGVKDGPRFLRTLKEAVRCKPVVVWKGGVTDAGARAISSHTGSLATAQHVWDAAIRQAGAVQAESLDDTIDAVKGFLHCKPPRGPRVGLMAMTGGQSVVITDAFVRAGLEVPLLTPASYEKLASFFNVIGGSYRNPLDMGGTIGFGGASANLQRLLDILEEDENVDAIAMEMGSGFLTRRWQADPKSLDQTLDLLAAHRDRSTKPFLLILHPAHIEDLVAQVRRKMQDRGLAVFPTFERAARSLRRLVEYHAWRAEI